MNLNLDGRCAIVTGGARGIGQAIATMLQSAGAAVHTVDMIQPENNGRDAIQYHICDITDPHAIEGMIKQIAQPVSILVNNAGITRDRTLMKMDDAEWSDVIAVNLTGAFNMMRAVAPEITAAGGGSIVNVTSINGIRGKVVGRPTTPPPRPG